MKFNVIGKSINRIDATSKVTGKAKYADDFLDDDMLTGMVLRSPHAHAKIKKIGVDEARSLNGVEAVITHGDLPRIKYATAGHPWSLEPEHRDVADRYVLTDKARFVGDIVAMVVAKDRPTAKKALELIKVEYEILSHAPDMETALDKEMVSIHDENPGNILSSAGYGYGDLSGFFSGEFEIFEGKFETQMVQHCNIENHSAQAYVDADGRLTVVTSTQVPHIVKRIVAMSLGLPWGKVRVLKPYVGGGFGNKQDAVIEPIVAAMSLSVKGRRVRYALTREECFIGTRVRHAMKFDLKTVLSKEGDLLGIDIKVLSNNGAYASHGHSVALNAGSKIPSLYKFKAMSYAPRTIYTNLPVAGAMRGYGVPQMTFALESHIDDISRKLGIDPIEFRMRNFVGEGHINQLSNNTVSSFGIRECIEKGKQLIQWDEKKRLYRNDRGEKKRGMGMACFAYEAGTHPEGLEIGGARIVMNQDGSVQLQIGATEIGQGSDTVFAQMCAEVLGIPVEMVHVVTTQDTDISPFDTGAYASRQTFVTGFAVEKAASQVRKKVLEIAGRKSKIGVDDLTIRDARIIETKGMREIASLESIAMESFYDRLNASPITSDVTSNVRVNVPSYGASFAEVDVDLKTGRIEVLNIFNIHDSGVIINPKLAEGQVHGGVSMGLGFALTEQMLFDKTSGKPLNNNLLDYKIQTILDTPEIGVGFVETCEPSASFSQKSLGEPPAISPAPAIRNAVLDATGIAFYKLPLTPQSVFEKFRECGLI
ncbi:MAG: xanthine dehydrogenase molybdenum-binding subunit XdhA [Oligoflexales bacterium]|nr:xanthine dehydrogenase molybdenum-binding subunit XdhA [Oligoflexales bacterium]